MNQPKFVLCDRCRGTGVTDHPAFSNGISQEQFDEDPDFEASYWKGHYDVPCEECDGLRVVDVSPNKNKKGNCPYCGLPEYKYTWNEAGYTHHESECRNSDCPGEEEEEGE